MTFVYVGSILIMKLIESPFLFDWDKNNRGKIERKHHVSVSEVEQTFEKESKFIFDDETHSELEKRYVLFGTTDEGRRLSIVFILRGDKIRVVTARDMSRRERKAYEEIKKTAKI